MYYVYVLRCAGDTLYTGITPDMHRRMTAHMTGRGAKYTRSHPPRSLAALWEAEDRTAAARLEYAVKKRLDRAGKEELIAAPERWSTLLPQLAALSFTPVSGVTLESCLEGERNV
ncbi:MAG: GIY-YIG nuclease family protein [Oscillospiraceae bacterium]|nr:GIY-YIG nuclease family protein [Oscillospiraceae bacterium]